jgi:Ycf66 protein N-terminus
VGFGTPVPLLVGIVLILIGIGLLFLDTFKPGYKRDSDTVYAILFMLAGLFALLSWQADFQMAMQFMISAGSLVALMVERIRSRSVNNEPMPPMSGRSSRRESRDDRPSRSYRAGFDESPRSEVRAEFDDDPISMEESSRVRRIRGGRDSSSARDSYQGQGAYFDQLSEDTREPRRSEGGRRSSSSYTDENQYGEEQRSRRRGSLQLEGDVTPDIGSYGEEQPASVEPSSGGRRRGRSNSSPSSEPEVPTGTRGSRRRSRSNGDRDPSRVSPLDGDYVDYKPLGMPKPSPSNDDDFDNSGNFDDNPNFR